MALDVHSLASNSNGQDRAQEKPPASEHRWRRIPPARENRLATSAVVMSLTVSSPPMNSTLFMSASDNSFLPSPLRTTAFTVMWSCREVDGYAAKPLQEMSPLLSFLPSLSLLLPPSPLLPLPPSPLLPLPQSPWRPSSSLSSRPASPWPPPCSSDSPRPPALSLAASAC